MLSRLLSRSAALAVVALGIAGCNGSGSGTLKTAKDLQPLSADTYVDLEKKGMRKEDPILVRIYKEESKLEVWKKRRQDGRYALFKSYDICKWSGKLGPKVKEGDKQAPEGFYAITPGQMNPKSSYYLSFNMGFPNSYDRALGRSGVHLMVHGACSSAGCYSMNDEQIAEIYALARESFAAGQRSFQVQALPFRMTAENLARHRANPNMSFWKNLKEGTDSFEVTRLEPKVDVCGKRYVFNAAPKDPAGAFEASGPCPAYSVPPEIATAVAAKARADEIRIAALSSEVPAAPTDIGQGGPIAPPAPAVMVADAAPKKPTAAVTVAAVPLPTPKPGASRPGIQVAAAGGALPSGEPSMLSRWLGMDEDDEASPADQGKKGDETGSVKKPVATAAAAPPSAPPATPVLRPAQPVAAPLPATPAPSGGGSAAQLLQETGVEAEAGAAPAKAPASKPFYKRIPGLGWLSSSNEAGQPPKRSDRSAALPPEFLQDRKPLPRVATAFAAFD